MNQMGKNKTTGRKSCPNATFYTTSLTWTGLGLKPGLWGDRPVSKRLSHGTTAIYALRSCL